jgi:DNA-binding CsgD family transcriptional regulator
VSQQGADPAERARAHLELGLALRRAGRPLDAREPLRAAVDLAHRCDATALEGQALAELRATGARPRRPLITGAGALTSSERRIAELAAAGHRNREIAAELVVTVATVEYHLRNAYRKLAISSRSQLGWALGSKRDEVRVRLNVRLGSGFVASLPTASKSHATALSAAFARTVCRSRLAPAPPSVYARWESRSNTSTATL